MWWEVGIGTWPVVDAGAVTWAKRSGDTTGPITDRNSVRGLAAGGGATMDSDHDAVHNQLVVSRPAENIVTLFRLSYVLILPVVLDDAR